MKVEIRSFYVQKLGNKLEEFEDAFDYKLTPDNLLLAMSEEFGSTPVIVGSTPAQNELSLSAIKPAHGKIQAGDIFIIATDAISDLIVRSYKNSWQEIAGISSQTEFESFVSQMRSQKELKNDDTTLVIVKIEEV